MPRTRDYQQGKIYKLTSIHINQIYIGSSCQPRLCQRLTQHIADYKHWLKTSKKYISSIEIIKHGDYEIVLLESFPCNSKDELNSREQYWINETKEFNVNKCKAFQTEEGLKEYKKEQMKEYYKANQEKIKEQIKDYHIANSVKINEKKKKYRQENRGQINQRQRESRKRKRKREEQLNNVS